MAPGLCVFCIGSVPGASPAEKLGWRLGCCAYSFNHLTFYETIGKVASLGLKQVVGFNWQKLDPRKADAVFREAMSAAQRHETKKRLGDAGVKIPCCYCNGLAEEDACRRLFDFAREMGIETLDGEPPVEAFDMLEKLCDEYQLNVAVHNHAKPSPYWKPETLLKAVPRAKQADRRLLRHGPLGSLGFESRRNPAEDSKAAFSRSI